jgi:hypothetical protein
MRPRGSERLIPTRRSPPCCESSRRTATPRSSTTCSTTRRTPSTGPATSAGGSTSSKTNSGGDRTSGPAARGAAGRLRPALRPIGSGVPHSPVAHPLPRRRPGHLRMKAHGPTANGVEPADAPGLWRGRTRRTSSTAWRRSRGRRSHKPLAPNTTIVKSASNRMLGLAALVFMDACAFHMGQIDFGRNGRMWSDPSIGAGVGAGH